jgi:hypothetical protein
MASFVNTYNCQWLIGRLEQREVVPLAVELGWRPDG